ncbi:hypothetical protein G6F50_016475 [Rhizopus delemar]|uniref:Uncharacterized protein n=1 Tax=Rhizopus delemar TaxID=936053 RepID=A0A9P7C203_9FUNG|nr:hypothetical protein G6F50_016475 [Rhizopus delemar]
MSAGTRDPSGRRASTMGELSSMRLPSGVTMRSITQRTDCSLAPPAKAQVAPDRPLRPAPRGTTTPCPHRWPNPHPWQRSGSASVRPLHATCHRSCPPHRAGVNPAPPATRRASAAVPEAAREAGAAVQAARVSTSARRLLAAQQSA